MTDGAAYLDASAFVKLLHPEPESAGLQQAIAELDWTASEILAVEVHRTARRLGGGASARASALLAAVELIPLSDGPRRSAESVGPTALRALDAIHLATAISVRAGLRGIFVYDHRLADAAGAAGLVVLQPR